MKGERGRVGGGGRDEEGGKGGIDTPWKCIHTSDQMKTMCVVECISVQQ